MRGDEVSLGSINSVPAVQKGMLGGVQGTRLCPRCVGAAPVNRVARTRRPGGFRHCRG